MESAGTNAIISNTVIDEYVVAPLEPYRRPISGPVKEDSVVVTLAVPTEVPFENPANCPTVAVTL